MVIFRNYQWGAEKRNTTLWYDDNFVGTELDLEAQLRQGRGRLRPQGRRRSRTHGELTEALRASGRGADEDGVTTFIEVMLNQELGEPFRRDAMKKPVAVAGIDREDMRPQLGLRGLKGGGGQLRRGRLWVRPRVLVRETGGRARAHQVDVGEDDDIVRSTGNRLRDRRPSRPIC